jgi:two-component system response regulator DevR
MPSMRASAAENPIRVVVVDDHELVRRGLSEVLEDAGDIAVVGECGTASEALRTIAAVRPDVVLLDIRLPDGSGIQVCREVRSADPSIQVLMLTSYEDEEAVAASVQAGARGVALKQIRSHELVEAIRNVAAGRALLTHSDRSPVMGRLQPAVEPEHMVATLSPQEQRVLDGIVDGLTNREIGKRLHLAEQTVKNHVSALLAKLGVERRTQAAVLGEHVRWHTTSSVQPAPGATGRYPRSPGTSR